MTRSRRAVLIIGYLALAVILFGLAWLIGNAQGSH